MLKILRGLFRHTRIFVPLAGLFFITTVYLLFRSDVFLLREFSFSQKTEFRLLSETQVQEKLSPYLARSLLTLNTSQIAKELLDNFLSLERVEITKKYPDQLQIAFWEREPVVVIQSGENYYLSDAHGLIFHLASERYKLNLPTLYVEREQSYQLGERLHSSIISASLEILSSLNKLGDVNLSAIKVKEQGIIVVETKQGWTAVLNSGKEIPEQITSLQTVVQAARMEGRRLGSIDLRYVRPVVRYK